MARRSRQSAAAWPTVCRPGHSMGSGDARANDRSIIAHPTAGARGGRVTTEDDQPASATGSGPSKPASLDHRGWHELLRGLRHELRTPINHIVGYSELLLEVAEERDQAGLLGDLRKIRAAGAELSMLIQESLESARRQTLLPNTTALSRDLRTPLNTIVGYSELLE